MLRAWTSLLVNIDVPELESAVAFYTRALGLTVGRRFGEDGVELLGAVARIYLLATAAGTTPAPGLGPHRHPGRPVRARVLPAAILRAGVRRDRGLTPWRPPREMRPSICAGPPCASSSWRLSAWLCCRVAGGAAPLPDPPRSPARPSADRRSSRTMRSRPTSPSARTALDMPR